MKILILTITGGQNFGNRLQNYALSKSLVKYAENVETAKNLTKAEDEYKFVTKVKLFVKSTAASFYMRLPKVNNITLNQWYRRKVFDKFTKKYIPQSKFVISEKNIPDNLKREYDYFISGSDQVWNPYYPFNSNIEFMDFADGKQRISYAASFGVSNIPEEKRAKYAEWLMNIPNISVREERGREIVKEISEREAEVVLDPTLLLTKEQWVNIEKKPSWLKKQKYIVEYFLGVDDLKINEQVEKISKTYNLPVIKLNNPKLKKEYSTAPDEMIYLLHHCELLCTDSFHGTIFAYQMDKPVVIFNRSLQHNEIEMNSRMNTIEKLLAVEDREIQKLDITNKEVLFSCDYSAIENELKKERDKADIFLKKALNIDE